MIWKYSRLLFVVSMCFVVTGICIAADDEFENLVQNADFEDGITAPWTRWVEDGAAAATMSIAKGDGLMDSDALLLDITQKGGGQRVELHQNPFVMEKGQVLTYAFWARVDEGDIREARMIANHRAAPWTSYGSKNFTITEEWTEFWTTVTMTADDPIVGLYVELRDTPGPTYFDNFRFYEGDYVEEDFGQPKIAVESHGKMATTWAGIKRDQ